jgi:hypothetical protein
MRKQANARQKSEPTWQRPATPHGLSAADTKGAEPETWCEGGIAMTRAHVVSPCESTAKE